MLTPRPAPNLDRFFRGLAEHAFLGRLGVVDPPLVDYVAALLSRFIRNEHLRSFPGGDAAVGDHLVMMLAALPPVPAADDAAEEAPAERRLEDAAPATWHGVAYRHIGDYTLFWTGLYPEAVERRTRAARGAGLDAYRVAGKRAYWLASTCDLEPAAERSLLERLSHDYDTCAEGLAEVRRAWGES